MYSTILVPTDGSAAAETAAKAALVLAQRFDASIHAIYVTELDDFPADVEPEDTETLTQQGKRHWRQSLTKQLRLGSLRQLTS